MQERRQDSRFLKQYTVIFSLKDQPNKTYDVSRLLDISKGGLKFFSYDCHPVGTIITFQIMFPFLYPQQTLVEGEVVNLEHVLRGKTYKISVMFHNITTQARAALEQMEHSNLKKK